MVKITNNHDLYMVEYILGDKSVVTYSVITTPNRSMYSIPGDSISLYNHSSPSMGELEKDPIKWCQDLKKATDGLDDYEEIAQKWIKPRYMESYGDVGKRLQMVLDKCVCLKDFINYIQNEKV
jgi:hypothetical protein